MEWEDVAAKLLDKKLYLSALELYYELLESNLEIHSLRDFFSNPGNFETFYNIPRSTSLQTFDSLDLVSRYSDDDINVADERVTVLEFELRKAQETINALRGTLTTSAAPEHKERNKSASSQDDNIIPYEKRCLNFLISEYMLSHEYKLTAITFSEETADQDFDDWEDVGLNCPRPPSLLGVYRSSDHHEMQALEEKCGELESKANELQSQLEASTSQVNQLKKLLAEYEENMKSPTSSTNDLVIIPQQHLKSGKGGEEKSVMVYLDQEGAVVTREERNRRQTSDCSVITQDSSNYGNSSNYGTCTQDSAEKDPPLDAVSVVESMNSYTTNEEITKRSEVELDLADATRESPCLPLGQSIPTSESGDEGMVTDNDNAVDEECEEEVDGTVQGDQPGGELDTIGDIGEETLRTSSPDIHHNETLSEEVIPLSESRPDFERENTLEDGECGTEDDQCGTEDSEIRTNGSGGRDMPIYGSGERECKASSESSDLLVKDSKESSDVDVISDKGSKHEKQNSSSESASSQTVFSVSTPFGECIKRLVCGAVQCRLSEEISHITDEPILVIGRSLPHVLPHVLLNKREELLPIILCLAVQHPEPAQRDQLLHLLFNLVKRPDYDQRQMIRAGCEVFAANVEKRRLEEELLPQCWEQISDKYIERRLLVSEACGTLSPHLSREVCSSLVLSILKQVLDDREDSVRESAVKNLSVVLTHIYNPDKISNLLEMLVKVLEDSSNKVQRAGLNIYLPTLSSWCVTQEVYLTSCYHTLLQQLSSAVLSNSSRHIATYLEALNISTVFLFASVLKQVSLETEGTEDQMTGEPEDAQFDITNVCVVLDINPRHLTSLVSHFNTTLVQGTVSDQLKSQCSWIQETALTTIVDTIKNLKEKSHIPEFTKLLVQMNLIMGRPFVQNVIKPVLTEHVSHASILPIYCAGVLAVCEEDKNELREFLYNTLNQYASQFIDVEPLAETFAELSQIRIVLHILVEVLNRALKEATNPHVKGIIAKICKGLCDCADPADIVTYVLPILSHLANDPDVFVQTATVLAFAVMLQRCTGPVSGIREQLDKFINTSVTTDVHIMMCELIESFTAVLPLCSPDIQRDFLIPRLATIGVSNSTISNKTKRRDITERLINAYKAILCSYITPDTLEHYIVPGLQALSNDAQDVLPEKHQTIELMLREVISKTTMPNEAETLSNTRSSNAFGAKMSGFFKKK